MTRSAHGDALVAAIDREARYAEYGAPGEPIKGSRLRRDYCTGCDEPIRVAADQVGKVHVCERCDYEDVRVRIRARQCMRRW